MASITEVARLAGVSRPPRRASSRRPTTRSARRRASASSRPPGAGLRPQRARPRPAQELRPGRGGHRPRHHRPVLRGGRARGGGRCDVGRLPRDHVQLGARTRSASGSYVRLLRSMRAAAVMFAGSGLDDPAANEEMARHLAAMRADGAAVVHLSPHADGEPEVGVDNAAGDRVDGRGARRPRPPADRVPRWADVAVRRARAARRVPPRARGRRDRDRRAAGAPTGFDAGRALARRHAARGRRAVHGDLLRQRPARAGALQRLPSSASTSRARSRSPGFDDISMAAMTAPSLSTVRLPLREIGRRGFEHADRARRRRPAPRGPADGRRPARLDGAAGAGRRAARPAAGRSAGPPDGGRARRSRRPRHRQQPGHRRGGRGQGRRRGRHRRRPLPPRPGRRPTATVGAGPRRRARRRRRSRPTSATAPRPRGS